jgi:hypothetical protein
MKAFLSKIGAIFVTLLGCSVLLAHDAGAVGSLSICIKATNTCVTGNNINILNIGTLQDAVVRIDSISGQIARVEANDSGSNDLLAFKGARVTFLQAVTNYEIEIRGTGFVSGPNLGNGPNYRLTATNQTFKRGAAGANLDMVKTKGFVTSGGYTNQVGGDDALDPALIKYIYTNSYTFFNGSYLDERVTMPNANRDLRINIWFTAQNTGGVQDIASFPSNGLELKNTTAPSGEDNPSDCDGCGQQPPPPPPTCTKSSMLSTTCATTHSTMKAFGCPTCVYDDEQIQKTAKARMFVENNLDNLEQDLARGGGEHLTALTVLLDVPETQRGVFCAEASGRYRIQAQQGPVTPEQLVATIQHARESRQISTERTQDGKQE